MSESSPRFDPVCPTSLPPEAHAPAAYVFRKPRRRSGPTRVSSPAPPVPTESNTDVSRFLKQAGVRDDMFAVDSVPDLRDVMDWLADNPSAQPVPDSVGSGEAVRVTALYECSGVCASLPAPRTASLVLRVGTSAPALCACCKVHWIRSPALDARTHLAEGQSE